jgi:ferredoxin-NADP reductase
MLAEQHIATLRTNEELGPQTRLLTFALEPATKFPYVAGKYIIVDTGLLLPDGKIRKRAYTLISFDEAAAIFQIAIRHVGIATEYLHALAPGQELKFSGPWGKYIPHDPDKNEDIWVIATDTGITAALGLLQASELSSRHKNISLSWWLTSQDYFLPRDFVEKKLGGNLHTFEVLDAPLIGDMERIESGQSWLTERLRTQCPTRIYLSGDGAIVLPWLEILAATGVSSDRIHIETFFNHAKSKA